MLSCYVTPTINLTSSNSGTEVKQYVLNLPKGVSVCQIIAMEYFITSPSTTGMSATFKLYDNLGTLVYTKSNIGTSTTQTCATLDPPASSQNSAAITFNPLLIEGGQFSFTPSTTAGSGATGSGVSCYTVMYVAISR